MKGLTDIPGIRVGHVSDYEAITGCTVILADGGAVAGVDMRGSATGSQEADVLNPLHITPYIHGLCLAGGSAYGLEAASGVRRYLESKKIGFSFGGAIVPIVPSSILFDLGIGRSDVRPTREMGQAAAAAASSEAVAEGNVGAGTGCTVGKVRGMRQAMKGGVGGFTIRLTQTLMVSALVAVNAFGDVIDPATGRIVAGARRSPDSKEFLNSAEAILRGSQGIGKGGNTTLAVVATNAKLTKTQATKLAQLAQCGMVRAISPVNTISDGDTSYALSTGSEAADFSAIGVAAAEAVVQATLRGVQQARTLGGVPGLL
jgi:L-aminopeptidase/D-esterase-like protein